MKIIDKKCYCWKRFFCPPTGNMNLTDNGYLFDPDSQYGNIFNPDVVSYDEIKSYQCLVILGEPGIGKSNTLKKYFEELSRVEKNNAMTTIYLDLRSYSSEDRLINSLFRSQDFLTAMESNKKVYMFLDSFDECLLRLNTVANIIIDEFNRFDIGNVFLRIACRTADWTPYFERGLQNIWSEEKVGVFEIAPLRRKDVIEACKVNDINHSKFLDEINKVNAVPFAIKPITLNFLINSYRERGELPKTQVDLYTEGCRLLCQESNKSRITSKLTGSYNVLERLAVASRIAALTIFSNKYAIWTGIDQGDVPDEDLKIMDIIGSTEEINGNSIGIGEDIVREVVSSGLFSSRGLNRMGWSHQTYAEFLAAKYIMNKKMNITQICSLMLNPYDAEQRIIPQLSQAAVWLVTMDSRVRDFILRSDPEIFLSSDIQNENYELKESLVDILLKYYDEEKLLGTGYSLHGKFNKLMHPNLGKQLNSYIIDKSKNRNVREFAIDIAKECEIKELQDEIIKIIFDNDEDYLLRITAALAISKMGDIKHKLRLKPLLFTEMENDPDDEIKGSILEAFWPQNLSTKELFSVLTNPKQDNYLGAYRAFLNNDVVNNLPVEDIPVALDWVERNIPSIDSIHTFQSIFDSIMLKAWEHLDKSGILDKFARTAFERIKKQYRIFNEERNPPYNEILKMEDNKRRMVLKSIVPLLPTGKNAWVWPIVHESGLITDKDFTWLVDQLLSADSDERKSVWLKIIKICINSTNTRTNAEHMNAIIKAYKVDSFLRKEISELMEPIRINSPEAQKLREQYDEWQEISHRQKRERTLLDPPPDARIRKCLDEFESGDLNAWWHLYRDLTLEPDSTHSGDNFESDITNLPGWKSADEETRERLLNAAKKYIVEKEPDPSKWIGTDTVWRPDLGGYRALDLLQRTEPEFIELIEQKVWQKWAHAILAFPITSSTITETHKKLIKIAYTNAPEEIIKNLMLIVDKENEKNGHIFITDIVENCWDDRLSEAILLKLKDMKFKTQSFDSLLSNLLKHQDIKSIEYAKHVLLLKINAEGVKRERAVISAANLLIYCTDEAWSAVWPIFQKDHLFGKSVITKIAHSYSRGQSNFYINLDENTIAELYMWMVKQYPYSEDPDRNKTGFYSARDHISDWRDSLLGHLKTIGTKSACEAIQRIKNEFPELDWLKWTLYNAKNNFRMKSWQPPKPKEILRLSSNRELRIIQSCSDLLNILIESLNRLNAKLRNEIPASKFLWNEDPQDKNKIRPKDEESLSDFVKLHFEEDLNRKGIVINREVKIRKGKTDIYVDAIIKRTNNNEYDIISVVIETKCCWNQEIKKAMETQLLNKYMKNSRLDYGIYLVGWFNSEKWDSDDKKRKRVPDISIENAEKMFSDQAIELSKDQKQIKSYVLDISWN